MVYRDGEPVITEVDQTKVSYGYTQSLTEQQKERACQNIDAVSTHTQELTEQKKQTARVNIDAVGKNDLMEIGEILPVDYYTAQGHLTTGQSCVEMGFTLPKPLPANAEVRLYGAIMVRHASAGYIRPVTTALTSNTYNLDTVTVETLSTVSRYIKINLYATSSTGKWLYSTSTVAENNRPCSVSFDANSYIEIVQKGE